MNNPDILPPSVVEIAGSRMQRRDLTVGRSVEREAFRGTDCRWVPMITRIMRQNFPLLLIPALLAPSLATAADWSSTWVRLPIECCILCLALYAYRWRYCRFFFWLVAAIVPWELFCRVCYGSPITIGSLESMEFTSIREAHELLSSHSDWLLLGSTYLIVVLFGCLIAQRGANPFSNRRLACALLICTMSIPIGGAVWVRKQPPINYRPATIAHNIKYMLLMESFPLNIAYAEYGIYIGQSAVQKEKARRNSFAFPGLKRLTTDARPEVYVVFIGESSRRESWSLFGYGRNTNPLLSLSPTVKEGLFLFDRVSSNANVTVNSLPLALTRATPAERWRANDEKSIVSLAKQAGFDTYWISTQEKFGGSANPITSIAEEADHVQFVRMHARNKQEFDEFSGSYDEDVLKPFEDAVTGNNGNPKTVIFIHTMGSHGNYSSRVPAYRAAFYRGGYAENAEDAKTKIAETVNAYDDSILYTDYVLKNVIDILAGLKYPSALLYFSDHGERLYCSAYPRESFGHGFILPSTDELDVPMLLWLSDSYQNQYPRLAEAARVNAHTRTSLKSVFDTFADLIRVDLIRPKRNESLISESPEPSTLDVIGVDGMVHAEGKPQQSCERQQQ